MVRDFTRRFSSPLNLDLHGLGGALERSSPGGSPACVEVVQVTSPIKSLPNMVHWCADPLRNGFVVVIPAAGVDINTFEHPTKQKKFRT